MKAILKIAKYFTLAIVGLAVVGVAGLFLVLGGANVVRYNLFPMLRHYEVAVEVTAEGRRQVIRATFRCRWRQYLRGLDGDPSGFYNRIRAMAKRLPSGAGLVIGPVNYCQHFVSDRPDAFYLPKTLKQPTIFWLDDAQSPTAIEGYLSPDYYTHENARIRYHGMTVRKVRKAKPTDPRAEVPWLKASYMRGGMGEPQIRDYRRNKTVMGEWRGFYARVMDESIWGQDEKLAEKLRLREVFGEVTWSHKLSFSFLHDSLPIRPIVIENSNLNLKTDKSTPNGLIFLRKDDGRTRSDFTFSIDGRFVTQEISFLESFDPKTKLIIFLKPIGLSPAGFIDR